jgi:hypothetical protein
MNKQDQAPKPWLWLVCATLAVLIIWVGNWILITYWRGWPERGLFGDSFGAVNTLFSGLAFAGLIVAIFLQQKQLNYQREDLELQRKELELTRLTLKDQKVEMELQNETLKLQLFENKFFQLMRYYDQITKSMQITGVLKSNEVDPEAYQGRICFQFIWERYSEEMFFTRNQMNEEQVEQFDDEFYQKYQETLDPYFNIIELIRESIIRTGGINNQFYSDLLSLQFSKYELLLIFYLCGYLKRFRALRVYLEEYSVFSKLNLYDSETAQGILLDPANDILMYSKQAYRRNFI